MMKSALCKMSQQIKKRDRFSKIVFGSWANETVSLSSKSSQHFYEWRFIKKNDDLQCWLLIFQNFSRENPSKIYKTSLA